MKTAERHRRDLVLLRYQLAAEAGDLETTAKIVEEAQEDDLLLNEILEIETILAQEDFAAVSFTLDSAKVQDLVARHLTQQEDQPPPPLTVGKVARRLIAEKGTPKEDEKTLSRLAESDVPIPARFSLRAVKDLLLQLGTQGSDRFQRLFHDTAVLLGLAESEAHAAYARKQKAKENVQEKNPDDEPKEGP